MANFGYLLGGNVHIVSLTRRSLAAFLKDLPLTISAEFETA